MPAQLGSALSLIYGPQPAQALLGSAVDLVYTAQVEAELSTTVTAATKAPWNAAALLAHTVKAGAPLTGIYNIGIKAPWLFNEQLSLGALTSSWIPANHADAVLTAVQPQPGQHLPMEEFCQWVKSKPADESPKGVWGDCGPVERGNPITAWSLSIPNDVAPEAPWGDGLPLNETTLGVIGPSKPSDDSRLGIWTKYSQQYFAGWGIVIEIEPAPPTEYPDPIVVPVLRSYVVINNVYLTRVDGNTVIPTTAMSITLDSDSWTWGFTASVPPSYLASLQPSMQGDPVEVMATFNGVNYLLLVESIGRTREFGKASLSVKGRGHAAYLSAPYSAVQNFSQPALRTAQQLMYEAINPFNDQVDGWMLDWGIDDWLVPGGVWSVSGTYMDAVKNITESVGAYVVPHKTQRILKIRHKYPLLPRDWATGPIDIELPSSAIITEGIDWQNKPAYNAVYVVGTGKSNTGAGIAGLVRVAATAGDMEAPLVVSDLITEPMAARMRGRAILGDTGKQALYSLSLPVLPSIGIIEPGTMVRYVDGGPVIGIVRGVSATASAQPTLRQTVQIEVHNG
jgi:hypothetical protein